MTKAREDIQNLVENVEWRKKRMKKEIKLCHVYVQTSHNEYKPHLLHAGINRLK